MATIANKGWYYTPHLIDSIEGGDTHHLLDSFRIKHQTLDVPDSVYEIVHDGMQQVMEQGTGSAAQVPGIVVCGKTGTVQNSYKGEKQKDHAFFGAFAPRDNPKIAIAVMCENAGMGAQSAAPIASLMIEQYLKDSIPEPERKAEVERVTNLNLIPKRMKDALATLDSIRRAKDSLKLIMKAKADVKDTIDVEEESEPEVKPAPSIKQKTIPPPAKKRKDSFQSSPAILPEENKIKKYTKLHAK